MKEGLPGQVASSDTAGLSRTRNADLGQRSGVLPGLRRCIEPELIAASVRSRPGHE
jgi:hypothetical protein